MLDELIELNGQSLHTFAMDYSAWTEMAAFLKTGDKHWAEINIDSSLTSFKADAAWVLQAGGQLHYSISRLKNDDLKTPPFLDEAFLATMGVQKMMHFFHVLPEGVLEVRTAPIQLSEDTTRRSPPLGWLIVARLWNQSFTDKLIRPMHSTASWRDLPWAPSNAEHIRLRRELSDWNGRIVSTLGVDYVPATLIPLLEGNHQESYVLYAFGLTVLSATVLGLYLAVIMPLNRLAQAMEFGEAGRLKDLTKTNNEFGHLARLVELSFVQRDALQHEVATRTKLEFSLRETESGLRHSIELLGRLARDLHDGVIQSIYAAGLGLEGVRSTLRSDPTVADQRLSACQKALNETIVEVRSFITTLDRGESSGQPFLFSKGLASLAENMEAFQQLKVSVAVDPNLSRRLSPEQELQILKFARESISNALRHAEAGSLLLALQPHGAEEAELTISDDGAGFDPAQNNHNGRGLLNLAARARELGGTFQLDSSFGKGTRVILRFKPAYPEQK